MGNQTVPFVGQEIFVKQIWVIDIEVHDRAVHRHVMVIDPVRVSVEDHAVLGNFRRIQVLSLKSISSAYSRYFLTLWKSWNYMTTPQFICKMFSGISGFR